MKFDYTSVLKGREEGKESWECLVPQGLSIGRTVEELLKLSVGYPEEIASVAYKVVAAYLVLPSALCLNVPIIFLYGASGSGKSQVGKFASKLWECKIYSPADTAASIRNDINKSKKHLVEYYQDDSELPYYRECEKNIMMVWDDIDPKILTAKPDIFRMLKVGCDRSTSIVSLSGEKTGSIMEFDCFSPKIFSSVTPIHTIPDFQELSRRMLVVTHKKTSILPIFMDDYDWTTLARKLQAFWDLTSAMAFVDFRNRLARRSDRAKLIEPSRWSILKDFFTAGIITGIWSDTDVAFADVAKFLEYQDKQSDRHREEIDILLGNFVAECEFSGQKEIHNSAIQARVKQWYVTGIISNSPSRGSIPQFMRSRGYVFVNGTWVKEF